MMTPTSMYHQSVYDEQLSDMTMKNLNNIIVGLNPISDFEVQIKNICGFLFSQIRELKTELKVHKHDHERNEELIVENEHYLEGVADLRKRSESARSCDETQGSSDMDAKRNANYQDVIDNEKDDGTHHELKCWDIKMELCEAEDTVKVESSESEVQLSEDNVKVEPSESVQVDHSVINYVVPPVLLPPEIEGQSQNVTTHHQPVPMELSSKTKVCLKDMHILCEKTYKCSECDKSFVWKGDLTRHTRIHARERPHKCSFCEKGFTEMGSLTNHMMTHTGERPYKCSVCGKGFIYKSHCTTHMMTHTGERPYKCSVCGKGFVNNSHVTRHMRIHTGERPYKCSVCGKGFTEKGSLTKHMRTHS